MDGIILLVVVVTSIWVLFDAKKIGIKKGQVKGFADIGPWGWFFGSLLLWIVGFPLYLAKRGEFILINSVTNGGAEAVKKCPECAETIKQEAKLCKFCGTRFDSP